MMDRPPIARGWFHSITPAGDNEPRCRLLQKALKYKRRKAAEAVAG
jgi:hypothetical protein